MEIVFLVLMFVLATALGFPAMGIVSLVLTVFFWMVIGNVAGHIIRGEDYGVAGNMALGLLGGVVGTTVLNWFGFAGFTQSLLGSFVTGIFGAVLVVYIMRLVDRSFGR